LLLAIINIQRLNAHIFYGRLYCIEKWVFKNKFQLRSGDAFRTIVLCGFSIKPSAENRKELVIENLIEYQSIFKAYKTAGNVTKQLSNKHYL
jgi:hypothetical protein